MIKVIIDSTSDIPRELMEHHHIDMIPVRVIVDDIDYKDKVTISVDKIYETLRNGNYCKTSQPNPNDAYEVMKKHAANGDDLLVISLSAKLSGTYQTINMVADQIKEEFPKVRIEVIDSKGGSGAPGLIAIQAARLVQEGLSFDEILPIMTDLANHVEHIFTIKDLKFIIRSGRVNKAEAFIGNILHVKPILHVVDGEIKFLTKVRGMKTALTTMVDIVEERIKNFPNQMIAIMHADDLDIAKELEGMLRERIGDFKVMIDKIGSALGTHIGLGGVGVFFFNKKPSIYIL